MATTAPKLRRLARDARRAALPCVLVSLSLAACGPATASSRARPRPSPSSAASSSASRAAPPAPPSLAPEVEAAFVRARAVADEMDAVFRDARASAPARDDDPPCPVDLAPARAADTRGLYLRHTFVAYEDDTAGGHVRAAANAILTARFSAEAWGGRLRDDAAFPFAKAEHYAEEEARDAIYRRVDAPTALAELRRVADPAFWTWDAFVVFYGASIGGTSTYFGRAYLVSYAERRLACRATFRVTFAPDPSRRSDDLAAELALGALRAPRR